MLLQSFPFLVFALGFSVATPTIWHGALSSLKHQTRSYLPTPQLESHGRRGLCYNDATKTQPFSVKGQSSKVSWALNWESTPYYQDVHNASNAFNHALEFVPTLWSAADEFTTIWDKNVEEAISDYGTKHLVAFNEPDGCSNGQACMNVSTAVAAYRKYMMPWARRGVKIGSPAVSNSKLPGQGLSWLKNFVAACDGCMIDFLTLHWYGDVHDPGSFKTYVSQAYKTFNSSFPIWVTELGANGGTTADSLAFMIEVLPWLDKQNHTQRYAYFMDKDGILMNKNGTALSELGVYYNIG